METWYIEFICKIISISGSLMIFPILPFMVHDFFPRMAASQIGEYYCVATVFQKFDFCLREYFIFE